MALLGRTYTRPIVIRGADNAAPFVGGTNPSLVQTTQPAPRPKPYVAVWQGGVDAVVTSTTTQPPLLVSAPALAPRQVQTIAQAAPAEVVSYGPQIIGFQPPARFVQPPIVTQGYNQSAVVTTTTTQSPLIVTAPAKSNINDVITLTGFNQPAATATYTASAVTVYKQPLKLAKNYVAIFVGGVDVAPSSDVFGSLGNTDVIGIFRVTSVMSPGLRTTTTYNPSRLSRTASIVRTTFGSLVSRATFGRIDSHLTRASDRTRNTGVK